MRSTSLTVLALAALTLSVSGCGRGRHAIAPNGLSAHEHELLLATASQTTGCPAGALSAEAISSTPVVMTVTGCGAPVEMLQVCGRRGRRCQWEPLARIEESAAGALQCPPQQIQQQPGQMPNQRWVQGCGRSAGFALNCGGAMCAWAQAGPVQMQGPAQFQAPQQQQQQTVTVQGNGSMNPGGNLEAQVAAQREILMSCIDSGNLVLNLRWTAEGQVLVSLPDNLAGTAAEGCIQAALGALRVQAASPGEITVPIQ